MTIIDPASVHYYITNRLFEYPYKISIDEVLFDGGKIDDVFLVETYVKRYSVKKKAIFEMISFSRLSIGYVTNEWTDLCEFGILAILIFCVCFGNLKF